MRSILRTRVVVVCLMSLVLVGLVGCATSPLTSAMSKVALGQMDTLTGPEISALIGKFAPTLALTNDQAADLAQFLGDYHIQSMADFDPLLKIISGQLDSLTTEDILSISGKFAPQAHLTQQQAAAIVQFLIDNQVKTIDDLQALIDQAQADPDSVQLPDGFEDLFNGFDAATLPDSLFV